MNSKVREVLMQNYESETYISICFFVFVKLDNVFFPVARTS